mgnify:FL=1
MLSWFEERLKLKNFFLKQILPRNYKMWFYFPIFFAFPILIWQAVSGIIMSIYCNDIENIKKIPAFLRNSHWIGANLLLLLIIIYILIKLYKGIYCKPYELNWFVSMVLFFIIITTFCFGALLPDYAEGNKNKIIIKKIIYDISVFNKNTEKLKSLNYKDLKLTWHYLFVLHISLFPLIITFLIVLYLWLLGRKNVEEQKL